MLQVSFDAFPPRECGARRRRRQGSLAHCRISLLDVEIAYAFQPRVRNDDIGGGSEHGIRIAASRGPAGKPTALLEHFHERNQHVALSSRGDQSIKRMDGAERVPQGKTGEIWEAGSLMHLLIEPEIIAVRIVKGGGHLKGPKQSGIENGLLLRGATLDADRRQFFFPGLARAGGRLIEGL